MRHMNHNMECNKFTIFEKQLDNVFCDLRRKQKKQNLINLALLTKSSKQNVCMVPCVII